MWNLAKTSNDWFLTYLILSYWVLTHFTISDLSNTSDTFWPTFDAFWSISDTTFDHLWHLFRFISGTFWSISNPRATFKGSIFQKVAQTSGQTRIRKPQNRTESERELAQNIFLNALQKKWIYHTFWHFQSRIHRIDTHRSDHFAMIWKLMSLFSQH